jgi:signal transduction histidine kinase
MGLLKGTLRAISFSFSIISSEVFLLLLLTRLNGILLSGPCSNISLVIRNRLCQAIQNLLKYAIRFTNEGSITVIVQRKENEILASIKDTGTGINPEVLSKLFTKLQLKQ